jgi:hypothetical protein
VKLETLFWGFVTEKMDLFLPEALLFAIILGVLPEKSQFLFAFEEAISSRKTKRRAFQHFFKFLLTHSEK